MAVTNGNGKVLSSVQGEIAGVERDFPSGLKAFSRYFLRTQDQSILARGNGKKLTDIYRDVAKDTKVTEGLAQRFGAVLARETVVEAASDSKLDKKVADEVRSQINNLNRRKLQLDNSKGAIYSFSSFDQLTLCLLDAIFIGYAVAEIDWRSDGDRIYIKQAWNRDQSRFAFNVGNGGYELRLITNADPLDGEELPARKFLVHTVGSTSGDPYGDGLAERLFWFNWFKRQNLKAWLIFGEKFGSPTLRGTYQTERQRDKLLQIMDNIAQQAGVALPEGVSLDVLQASSGSTDTYEKMCSYCDAQIIESILLQNLTTNVSGGSYAAAETHFEVRTELTDSDCSLLSSGPYTDLGNWITDFNFGIDATPPLIYKPRIKSPDLNRVNRDKILVDMVGRPLSEEYLKTFFDTQFVSEEELAKKQQAEQAAQAQQQNENPFAFSEPQAIIEKFVAGNATNVEIDSLLSLMFGEGGELDPQIASEKLTLGGAAKSEIDSILNLLCP